MKFQEAVSKVSELINIRKEEYQNHIACKLNDPMTNTKTYWSILKTFYNGKKVPVIPPLLINKLILDFKVKANHFNHFFASQCIPLNNNSKLPENQTYVTNTKLSSVKFEDTEIINIIRSLNVSKAHDHDVISIRMLQICDSAIVKPLSIIFNNCITQSIFPDIWKKSNICPIHKKGDKQAINNYRPVSLLPICGKILQRLIFKYIEENKLLSVHQSGFRCNDSSVNQLLSIVHNIYKALDAYPTLETCDVFLDMSKVFDKVWHEGLIFKLKSVGVSDSLLSLTESFLSNRFQRVLLNGQTSEWLSVKAGVPQGSILGTLFFLIYINVLSDDIVSKVKLFADDTSLFSVVHNSNITAKELNKDLQKISEWAYKWKMSFNPDLNKQAQEVVFSRKLNKASQPQITFDNAPVFCANWQKHLGMYLDESLNFNYHIREKMSKAMKGIGIIKKLSKVLPRHSLVTIYKSFVRPHLDYGDIIYDQPNNESFNQKIERIQYTAALAITGAIRGTSQKKLYDELGFESLKFRCWFRKLCIFYKIKNTGIPGYLFDLIPQTNHSIPAHQKILQHFIVELIF